MSTQKSCNAFSPAFEGYITHFNACRPFEEALAYLVVLACARSSDGQFSRTFFCLSDDVTNRFERRIGLYNNQLLIKGKVADQGEFTKGGSSLPRYQCRLRLTGNEGQEDMGVTLLLGDRCCSDEAAPTSLVSNEEGYGS